MKTVRAYFRIIIWGVISFVSGTLTVEWGGNSWWSRAVACLTVLLTMAYVIVSDPYAPEAPDGGS